MKTIYIILAMLISPSMLTFGQHSDSMENKFVISANGKELTATFADNNSAKTFRNLIGDAPLTIQMSDYGNFEKVGAIGQSLPTDDHHVSTVIGDIMLYNGNSITIFYGANSWSYTPLGKIDGNPTRELIISVLGNGTVNVTFSLKKASAGMETVSTELKQLKVSVNGRNLTVAECNDAVVSVYSLDGRIVYSGKSHSIELPATGIYIVECNGTKAKILVN